MKRLAAILLIAWCTAFAQVQPVVRVVEEASCCCEDCQCGPECAPVSTLPGAPAARFTNIEAGQEFSVARKAARTVARTKVAAPKFGPAAKRAFERSDVAPIDDPVPLFTRHCAFLI